jgi:hypothetical protein
LEARPGPAQDSIFKGLRRQTTLTARIGRIRLFGALSNRRMLGLLPLGGRDALIAAALVALTAGGAWLIHRLAKKRPRQSDDDWKNDQW